MNRLQRGTTWVVLGAFTLLTACLPGLHTCGIRNGHSVCAAAVSSDLRPARVLPAAFSGPTAAIIGTCLTPAESSCAACKFLRNAQSVGAASAADFTGFDAETLRAPMPDAPILIAQFAPLSPRAPPPAVSL